MPKESGGHRYGPVESPMSEDFRPEDGHQPSGAAHTGTMPGYPASNDGKIKEVILYEGGNFGLADVTKPKRPE